ncbi:MAG: hypothetical protein ACD_52C00087G0006 [uncultured bacterium]|uniref:Uncharacterized protein n=1 Tax=Candidatus Woesebacteria bacterium RIFCSPHIGHO2_12_FULL_41_24 TaxID=1802510 RepID=A0A1F8AU79_9BACT|nr:MAG: hypothetical protein ACD_52C00087G0006 [uncultured bacterium]OGM14230.1 MAG: hypothetical protein A2W15_04140 [Candidatus Woesebacteria bacterium RBG_16_41_13]OGM29106.1 MAG: hypothetical protein A2873_00025 [Candidatus Woesebacteria bacterium RIFCSPHIGHO2_01_FULL_42_80]OGM35691.1 MAG: hypothetical protein A3D84_03985 [Candidatus Woesebacteria bacterium RIFCSPHIGHO2_02_FULL_42_20]OGM55302.1 MAG: hypothetical protein A3E44_03395 [Candidatus Woesebacteria bacterium RIFCSPHIGHO2_12_FULL_41
MLLIIKKKATKDQIKNMAQDFDGYIKVVVDVDQEMLAGGGQRHFEGEQKLLQEGSRQENLWGGGIDLESREIDYNSIINLRPNRNNPGRDIMSADIRKKFDMIVKELLL